MLSNLEIIESKKFLGSAKLDSAYGLVQFGSHFFSFFYRNFPHPIISKLDSLLSYYIYKYEKLAAFSKIRKTTEKFTKIYNARVQPLFCS